MAANEVEGEARVININPAILGGTPVFMGTRVPIRNLFDCLEEGGSIEDFLSDFSGVRRTQVIRIMEISKKLIG